MTQLLKPLLRGENVVIRYTLQNLTERQKMRTARSCNFIGAAVFPACHGPFMNLPNEQNNRNKHFNSIFRTFTSNTKSQNNTNGSRVIVIPRTVTRLGKKIKIREALEDRQRKIQKGVENVLEDRRVALTNTRRRIQEKGKLLMQDIKETKEKMKEKFGEVIEKYFGHKSLELIERTKKENIYTIPNLLCVTRIGLSPLLGYLIVAQKFEYALAFMIVAGISDWVNPYSFIFYAKKLIPLKYHPFVMFDGWIARNYKSQASKIGSFLDPMSDKVLIGTLFITLTYVDLIPVPLTALIIGRDIVLIISGFVIRYRSLPPPRTLSRYFDVTHATAQLAPTFISKVNTGVQLLLVATTLAAPVFGYVNHQFLQALWYVTAASTAVAATSYIFSKETYKYLKAKEKTKNRRK